jgi:curli biogenesis system outer membrane secretion channel CsgG
MKKVLFFLCLLCLVSGSFTNSFAASKEKPRIGVLRFTNNTSAGWWQGTAGTELQDMLIAELASTKAFRVLERKELDAVISEQALGASSLVNKKTAARMRNLTGAKYLVAATVSAFEEDTGDDNKGLSFMGVSVGSKGGTAYMAVDLKVIDTETGEIADSRTVEATSKSSGLQLGLSTGFFSGNLGKQSKTPTGKAIRACIIEAGDYLVCSMSKGKDSDCMKDYEKKESKRREKTKGSIDLE